MLRHTLVLAVACWAAGAATEKSWAQALLGERSYDFGTVPRGPTLLHSFHLTNSTSGPIHINSVRASCSCVSASISSTDLAPGETATLVVRLDTSRVHGFTQKAIYVHLDQPQGEEVPFRVQTTIREDVVLSPDSLAFGRVKRGSSPEANVTARFFSSADCQTVVATCDSPCVEVSVRKVPGDATPASYQITARLRPDFPVGTWYSTVWLATDNPALPRLQIPLTVEVGSSLRISPPSVALEQVKRDTEARRTVVVRADQPFRILEVKGADAQLLVEEGVQGGTAVHVLTIKFQARSPGVLLRTIRIITDLPEDNSIDLQMTAEVVPSPAC